MYVVIECKSSVENDEILKFDGSQLNTSIVWFEKNYDYTCGVIPLMIHPVIKCFKSTLLRHDTRIMDVANLEKLKQNFKKYIKVAASVNKMDDKDSIAEQLDYFDLISGKFINSFTKKFKE